MDIYARASAKLVYSFARAHGVDVDEGPFVPSSPWMEDPRHEEERLRERTREPEKALSVEAERNPKVESF